MSRLENVMVKYYEDSNNKLNALIESQMRTDRFQEDTSTKLNALIDSQLRTDQRLSEMNDRQAVFMDVVERLAKAGSNGSKKGSKLSVRKPRRPTKRKN